MLRGRCGVGDRHIQDDTERASAAVGVRSDRRPVQVHLHRRQALRRTDQKRRLRSAVAARPPVAAREYKATKRPLTHTPRVAAREMVAFTRTLHWALLRCTGKALLVYSLAHHPGWLGSRVVSVLDSGAEGRGFKSQPRRCRVTVLGKLFTSVVPLYTKQRNW